MMVLGFVFFFFLDVAISLDLPFGCLVVAFKAICILLIFEFPLIG